MKRPNFLYRPSDGQRFILMENGKYVLDIEGAVVQHDYEKLIQFGFTDKPVKCDIDKPRKCGKCSCGR